jgi:hypothetical protein
LAEWFWWDVQARFCNVLHYIPLPSPFAKWKRRWDDWDEDPIAFGDYYGDDLGYVWDVFICNPGFNLIWKHLSQDYICFPMPLQEARSKFKCYPEKLQWIEREIERRKKAE